MLYVLLCFSVQHHTSSSNSSHASSSDIAGPSSNPSTSGVGGASTGLQVPSDSYAANRRHQGTASSSAATSGKVPKWFKVGK